VGALAAQRNPEAFRAYIGLGQAVHGKRNEEVSYQFVLDEARRRGDETALTQLEAISPPYPSVEDLGVQRRWLVTYGGTVFNGEAASEVLWPALFGREYTLATRLGFFGCMQNSLDLMWDEFVEIDLFQQIPRLEVPVYLLIGRHDFNTPFELAVEWAGQLSAPKVEIVWLEDVAHMAPLEDPIAFQRALIDRVLAETPPSGR
jgi:pimeloyl-ACP methyl ester carboxylesterase